MNGKINILNAEKIKYNITFEKLKDERMEEKKKKKNHLLTNGCTQITVSFSCKIDGGVEIILHINT
jgi:hypothetical protein